MPVWDPHFKETRWLKTNLSRCSEYQLTSNYLTTFTHKIKKRAKLITQPVKYLTFKSWVLSSTPQNPCKTSQAWWHMLGITELERWRQWIPEAGSSSMRDPDSKNQLHLGNNSWLCPQVPTCMGTHVLAPEYLHMNKHAGTCAHTQAHTHMNVHKAVGWRRGLSGENIWHTGVKPRFISLHTQWVHTHVNIQVHTNTCKTKSK